MIVVLEPEVASHADLRQEIGGDADVVIVTEFAELREELTRHDTLLEAVVLGQGFDADSGLDVARNITDRHPHVGVILLVDELSPEVLRKGLRGGLSDVLGADRPAGELRAAIDRAAVRAAQIRGQAASSQSGGLGARGKVVTVFSTKGGCGKSLVATNLAILLAKRTKQDVALVDLDLQSGDLAIMLQLLPAWTIYDAALQGDRVDEDALRGYLTSHRSGVRLLAAPLDPALAETIDAESVQRILALLRGMFPYVIVDSPAFFSDQVLAALDVSHECVLVGSMDVPSVKNLRLALQTLEALGFHRNRIRVALNRADSNVGLRLQEVEKSLGTAVDTSIPSSRDVPLSVNQGTPLAQDKPKSSIVSAIDEIAAAVSVRIASESDQRRWFGLRTSKKG